MANAIARLRHDRPPDTSVVECRMPFRIRITIIVLGLLAAAVLLLPLLWPVPPIEGTLAAEGLMDADAVLIPAGEVRLHATVRMPPGGGDGAAPPAEGFVFLHGFGSNVRSFTSLLDALATRRPAVAYDRPGFGLTDRPLGGWQRNPYGPEAQVDHVVAVLDHLGLERAVLVGNSAGGAIALRTALERPDRVAGLVLIAPAVYRAGGAPAATRWLLHTPQLERLGPLFMRQLAGDPGENFLRAAYADPERLSPEVLEAYRQATTVHDWDRALWEVTQAAREPDLEGNLNEVGVPSLVLSGDADEIVPADLSRRVAEALPSSRYVTLEGCGHLPQEECPSAVLTAVADWLDDVDVWR